ncbi:amino acid adenylation domain-containing protein [Catenulispora sp. EB89]|uniref:non-ribosomal peptide synthetase n=1 Tax=Catenulispora sp. EB89 TaxID=3156257 RepID=UPI003514FE1C
MTTSPDPDKGVPLSFVQEQIWFLEKLNPGAMAYHVITAVRLRGPLRVDVLQDCLTRLVARHDALRMTFHSIDGVPFQVTQPPAPVELEVLALGGSAEQEQLRLCQEKVRRLAGVPFDLEHGPVYRYQLLKLADDDHVFVQIVHHIATDGWSDEVMTRELGLMYAALLEGREPDLDKPAPSYVQYATRQRARMSGERLDEELTWWTERLTGLPALEFPEDRPWREGPSRGEATVAKPFPDELLSRARRLAEEHGASLYMVLVSALNVVLSRYTGQDDLPVGVPMPNRTDEEAERAVGCFVNMVVLRTDLSGDPAFSALLERVADANMDLYEHQEVPLSLIVDKLQPVRAAGKNPLFQIEAQLLRAADSGAGLDLPGLICTPVPMPATGLAFDMVIEFIEDGDHLTARVEYSRDLFDEWRISALLDHLEVVLAAAVDRPSLRVSQMPLLTRREQDELLGLGNGGHAEYSADPLYASVDRVAQARPDAVAVVCGGAELSYGELSRRSDHLARYLRALGAEPGQVVAIVLDRRIDAFVAMVGVLKAGCAYTVMDPKLPAARVGLMIRDAAAPVVLTSSAFADSLDEPADRAVVLLDADWQKIEAEADGAPLPEAAPDSLAYVIYTSGSTGVPKGVLIEHRGMSLFREAFRDSFGFQASDRLLQLPALTFDQSQGEMWTAFLVGATVVAVHADDLDSIGALSTLMREQRVTYAALPLAMQSLLDPDSLPDLKYIVGGAEGLDPALVNKWNLPGRTFLNLYGPTECAVAQTEYKVDHVEWRTSPPIGRPHPNRRVYVVDRWDNLVPKGVNGELLIGGDQGGLARGYLNQPEATAQKFVADPFNPPGKVYRSGDLVRWNAAGQIDFLGRMDNQVKLRGLRIELGEIELALQSHPGVRRAIVLMRPDSHGENRLIAYLTSVGEPPAAAELRRHLGDSLPDYMVPSAWVFLDEFPMNEDGWKVDHKALPSPADTAEGGAAPSSPATPMEEQVARCFAEVLDVGQIEPGGGFFDSGGNSLQAMRMVDRLSKTFGVKVGIQELFGNQTVAGLAAAIEELIRARSDA